MAKATKTKSGNVPTISEPPSVEEAIRNRAYQIWEEERHPVGKDLEHWLKAEAELKQKSASSTRSKATTTDSTAPSGGRRTRTKTARE